MLSATRASHPAVAVELERILSSAPFQSSARSRELLRYLVDKALSGCGCLKERTIGCDVFGRSGTYDPAEDSIVRVAAHEVRQRLDRYYADQPPGPGVRIHLRTGTYIPEFEEVPAVVEAPAELPPATRKRRWWIAGAFVALGAVAATLIQMGLRPTETPLDALWAPLLNASQATVICVGPVPAATLGDPGRALAVSRAAHMPSGAILRLSDLGLADSNPVLVPGTLVGIGAAMTVHNIGYLFGRHQKHTQLRMVKDVSLADISRNPVVLVGAFSNTWTLDTLKGLRFTLADRSILDRERAGVEWRGKLEADGTVSEDYAVVARLLQHRSRKPVVIAAGLTVFGTGAAGEFLTHPEHVADWTRHLPRDWRVRNLEAVIKVRVVAGSIGTPQVVVSHVWE
jgi:hypothetical protein